MSSLLMAGKRFALWGLVWVSPVLVLGQNSYLASGTQYLLSGGLPGDQTRPQISVNGSGGYMVWQDNVTDGDGFGISARRIDRNFSGALGVFRVNEQGDGDQENPQVSVLKNGGAVFVWQGGKLGSQHIYARFLDPTGVFITGDVLVNTYTQRQQVDPALTPLQDGTVLIVWSSYGQDGSMDGVFGQRLSSTGEKIDSEFPVNQSTLYNQRSPAAATLTNGNIALVWVSESGSDSVGTFSVDIVGRMFSPTGALGNEFRINTGTNICANPAVGASADGGFLVAWAQLDSKVTETTTNSWDIFARALDAGGRAKGPDQRVNTFTYGDQYAPKVAGATDYLVVWTSLGQDGSREGVFGQFISGEGTPIGGEILVNTATANRQIDPVPTTGGGNRFVVVWSGFIGGNASYELFGQRYEAAANSLLAPAAPYVSALSQSRLSVAWPELDGLGVDHFELYVDNSTAPASVTDNIYTATGLAPGSSHSFRLAYQLKDGRRSASSAPATGTTWGEDNNLDGLPDDWQALYWGSDPAQWPSPQAVSDGDGATNLQEFLAGTDPKDPNRVLRAQLVSTSQGTRLSWNSQPGLMYQAQISNDVTSWTNYGAPRFAAETSDSVLINGTNAAAYFRVIRLR